MTRLTRAQRDEIVAAYWRGRNTLDLAGHYNISRRTLYKVLQARGIRGARKLAQDENRKQDMIDAYGRGDSLRMVGQNFGLSASGVRNLLLRSGVTLRPRSVPQSGPVTPQLSSVSSRRHPLSETERARILQLHDDGKRAAEIAVLCGVCSSSVYRVLQAAGLPTRPWRKISPGARLAIVASYQQGKTLRQVGSQFSISPEKVRLILLEFGIQIRTSAEYRKDSQ